MLPDSLPFDFTLFLRNLFRTVGLSTFIYSDWATLTAEFPTTTEDTASFECDIPRFTLEPPLNHTPLLGLT